MRSPILLAGCVLLLCIGCGSSDSASTAPANPSASAPTPGSAANTTASDTKANTDTFEKNIVGTWNATNDMKGFHAVFTFNADGTFEDDAHMPIDVKDAQTTLHTTAKGTYTGNGDKLTMNFTSIKFENGNGLSAHIDKNGAASEDEALKKQPPTEATLDWKDKDNVVMTSKPASGSGSTQVTTLTRVSQGALTTTG